MPRISLRILSPAREFIDIIPDPWEVKYLDEVKGDCSGSFKVPFDYKRLVDTPAIKQKRNVVQVVVDGKVEGAWLMRNWHVVLSGSGERASLYWEFSGPGLREWLHDAVVYPASIFHAVSQPLPLDAQVIVGASPDNSGVVTGTTASGGGTTTPTTTGTVSVDYIGSYTPQDAGAATPPPPTPTVQPTPPAVSIASGASGSGAGYGSDTTSFGTWRGTPLTIIGSWAAGLDLGSFKSGGGLANWTGAVDLGVGAFQAGGSWAAAASGTYDSLWRSFLTSLASLRAGRGTTYLRFAWEMNGYWFPWGVNSTNVADFIAGWKRFRAIQQSVFPTAQVVFSLNRDTNTNGVGNMDPRDMYPGAAYVDVHGVDYYNRYPSATSLAQFTSALNGTDSFGGPIGLEQHRQFALAQGKPLSLNEWGGAATETGDIPDFIQGMHDFFTTHAGTGAGNVLYDVYFNVVKDNDNYHLHDATTPTRLPLSANLYQQLF